MEKPKPDTRLFAPESLKSFQLALRRWFPTARRSLPWRNTADAYHIWVSEVMLQQTRVATVVPYFQRFVQAFPTVADLAAADQQEVLKLWEGLGYYARARNLHQAARCIVEEHGGKFPDNYQAFRKLPGVGDYIAAAVQSIAFGATHAVVDGNVKRVLARLFLLEAPANSSSTVRVFQEVAAAILDPQHPGDFNQAMMELGALVCRPHNPACEDCPVAPFCLARQQGRQQEFPRRKPRRRTPAYRHAVAVVYRRNRAAHQPEPQFLIVQRPAEGLLGGLWEFPGNEIRPGENPALACRRIVRDALGLVISPRLFLTRIKHAFTHFKLTAEVFLCEGKGDTIPRKTVVPFRWVSFEELAQFPFSRVNQQIISRLAELPDWPDAESGKD